MTATRSNATYRHLRLFSALESAAGTPTGVVSLTFLYSVSAVLQGIAFILTIPLLRQLLEGTPAGAVAWVGFAMCVVGAGAAHVTGMMRSARISVYAICDRMLRRMGEKVTRIALGWFDSSSSGRVSQAMAADIHTLSHLGPVVLPGLITGVLTPLTVAVATLLINPWVGLALLVTIPLGVACILWTVGVLGRTHPLEKQADLRMSAAVLEGAALQPLLRASGRTGLGWEHLAEAVAEDSDAELARMRAEGRPTKLFHLGTQLCFAVALVAIALALLASHVDLPTFAVLCLLAVRCVEPLTLAINYAGELFKNQAAVEAIISILDAPELSEPEHPPAQADSSGIRLDEVAFGYGSDAPVLRGVNLEASPGGLVALVGPSGAGKSTLLRLIARFWDVDEGTVRIGGVDVREIGSARLMEQTAFVFQNVFLFNTTVRENIRMARADATDDDVLRAVHDARLDDVIARLPQGLDTQVGQGGLLLSGGERQRVAIARALLKRAPILLLDEITSALDAENELALTRTLRDYAQDHTVIMIAHRGAAVAAADRVLTVSDGQVIATEGRTS